MGRKESNKAFKDPISHRYRVFIPATVEDNPTLADADPEYVRFLDSLPEPMRSAWRHGDWDVFAGQYFPEFNPLVHVVDDDRAKKLGFGKEYNHKYIGIDWGYASPFACIWIEVTPNNRVFCYRELYGREKHPMEWAEEIAKQSQGENIEQSLGDPSMWIRNPMSWRKPESPMYSDHSIANALIGDSNQPFVPNLTPANNDRINGWRNLAQMMHFTEKKPPNFYILKGTCSNLIRTIPDMICDEKRPEDLDTTLEDHVLDALRYAISSTQAPTATKKKKSKDELKYERLLEPTPNNWGYKFKD